MLQGSSRGARRGIRGARRGARSSAAAATAAARPTTTRGLDAIGPTPSKRERPAFSRSSRTHSKTKTPSYNSPKNNNKQARDAYYECLREAGVLPAPGQPPPKACKAARALFSRDCLPSWVAYFDEQRLRETSRRSAALGQAIRAGAGTAAGGLAGKAQQ